jgi:uracil-DNA glycosylase
MLEQLLADIRGCRLCEELPLGPNPILQAQAGARILIAGQAPGRITHHKSRPFDDPSGTNLRNWLGIDRETFYDPSQIAIVAMGFCYPGTGRGGDLPPRPVCAATWRAKLLNSLPQVKLTLAIGQYAQAWHCPQLQHLTLTERVFDASNGKNGVFALPHPRNGIWQKRNPRFQSELLPRLRQLVGKVLAF